MKIVLCCWFLLITIELTHQGVESKKENGIKGGLTFRHPSRMKYLETTVNAPGSFLRLPCHAQGRGPITYTWYKNGTRFRKGRSKPRGYVTTPLLKAKRLAPGRWNYTCVVTNGVHTISFTFNVKVVEAIRSRPYLNMDYPRDQTVKFGQDVTFECYEKTLHVQPLFQWLFRNDKPNPRRQQEGILRWNGTLINSRYHEAVKYKQGGNGDYHGSKLHLYNVTKKQRGYYVCLVGNARGFDFSYARLKVRGKKRKAKTDSFKIPMISN